MGEGSIDAFVGIVGGLVGGLVFAWLWPSMQGVIGPDTGAVSLSTAVGGVPWLYSLLVFVLAVGVFYAAWWMHRLEAGSVRGMKWLWSGIGLAVLNGVMILDAVSGRLIGASTSFPWTAAQITGLTQLSYIERIAVPGAWEAVFLLGAFLAALAGSMFRGTFRLTLIHERWRYYKGDSRARRIAWALIGGFMIVFGARMAGGCTSGHILSGGMQLAESALIFSVVVFAAFLLTGKLFYRGERRYGTLPSAEV
jgi:hypothetical protein